MRYLLIWNIVLTATVMVLGVNQYFMGQKIKVMAELLIKVANIIIGG